MAAVAGPRILQPPQSISTRNVHIYEHSGRVLGGVWQNGSITNRSFVDMCDVFLRVGDSATRWHIYELADNGTTGSRLQRNSNRLREGRYIVLGPAARPIQVNLSTARVIPRVLSRTGRTSCLSDKQAHFRDCIRDRDQVCAASGSSLGEGFVALEAAHIFPIAQEVTWNQRGYSHWISDDTSADKIGQNRIYSPQNGLLLKSDVHQAFDCYFFAINPCDNYKVTWFRPGDALNLDGRSLRPNAVNAIPNHRVSDRALRWHFEQAVFKNMRGAAEEKWPSWEHDFGEGEDIVGTIMEGPEAGQRMELEIASRLGAGEDVRVIRDEAADDDEPEKPVETIDK